MGNDYTYDVNGNMTKDLNKGITDIIYNHLNLPTRVTIGGKNIDYTYDAGGVKLSKTVSGVATQYAGNYIYKKNPRRGAQLKLAFFNHPEGYVSPKNASDISQGFKYVYQYKDHLGNVRLSYTDNNNDGVITPSTEIIEESNYYPFGLKHKGYNNITNSLGNSAAQKFGYNGKELNEELGIQWHDFGARNYDASLGRFMNIDPLAEINQRSWTPYHYVKNNPIKFTDPSGMIWKDPSKAEDLKKKINNRKNSLAKTKTRLQKKLGKEGISDKKKARLEKRIAGIDSRTESLDGSIADIDALGADQENTFDLVSSNSDTNHVKKGSDGVINIQGSTDALHIHEIKHTALSLSSEKGLDFNSNNYLKPALSSNGLKDEIAAYKAQHAYSPSSLPGSVSSGSGINIKYIANLKKSDGTPVYPAISRSWKARQRGIKSYKKYLKQKVKK
ncbi:RHS repeat domain-containing protein [Tenacibaculum maritimum]|uniref:RHS repeat domain-containing protein n=2 Tax=Tenacibaculum maritimum TaxID=107401 RepID=UPI00388F0277